MDEVHGLPRTHVRFALHTEEHVRHSPPMCSCMLSVQPILAEKT